MKLEFSIAANSDPPQKKNKKHGGVMSDTEAKQVILLSTKMPMLADMWVAN